MNLAPLQVLFLAASPVSTNSWVWIGWLGWSLSIGALLGGTVGYLGSTPRSLNPKRLERPVVAGMIGAVVAFPALFILYFLVGLSGTPANLLPPSLFRTTGLGAGLPRQETVVIFQAIFAGIGGFIGSHLK